jgi:hypothetical protein
MSALLTYFFVSKVELRRLFSDRGEYFFHVRERNLLYVEVQSELSATIDVHSRRVLVCNMQRATRQATQPLSERKGA